jgi:hypothetical protein
VAYFFDPSAPEQQLYLIGVEQGTPGCAQRMLLTHARLRVIFGHLRLLSGVLESRPKAQEARFSFLIKLSRLSFKDCLLRMVRKLNPTFLPKRIKAFVNPREAFAKRHHFSTNYRGVGVEVPFIVCHRQKGQGEQLKVVGETAHHRVLPELRLDRSDPRHT